MLQPLLNVNCKFYQSRKQYTNNDPDKYANGMLSKYACVFVYYIVYYTTSTSI